MQASNLAHFWGLFGILRDGVEMGEWERPAASWEYGAVGRAWHPGLVLGLGMVCSWGSELRTHGGTHVQLQAETLPKQPDPCLSN